MALVSNTSSRRLLVPVNFINIGGKILYMYCLPYRYRSDKHRRLDSILGLETKTDERLLRHAGRPLLVSLPWVSSSGRHTTDDDREREQAAKLFLIAAVVSDMTTFSGVCILRCCETR